MSSSTSELARAKINISLVVHGRLPNGYHALESLVAFTDDAVADVLTVCADRPSRAPGPTQVLGDGGAAIALAGDNLIDVARRVLAQSHPALRLPEVILHKRLPVAAGIGGGSADVAAYLRLVRRLNPRAAAIDWAAIALDLGADVPVCLYSRPARMTGIGDRLTPVHWPAPLPVVLANPCCPVPTTKTRDVFRALAAAAIDSAPEPRGWPEAQDPIAILAQTANDLEAPATRVMPEIGAVRRRLERLDDVVAVRLSGAGPTMFAVMGSVEAARCAAAAVSADRPGWWVRAATLGPVDPT